VVEKIESSPEGSPIKNSETPTQPQASPVPGSEQASTETSPPSKQSPTSRPVPKRKVTSKYGTTTKQAAEHPSKRVNTLVSPSPQLAIFLKRGVVRGKIAKVSYFREEGLEVFLDKLRDQGWLELFMNTQMGCFQPDLAEFYGNVSVTEGRVTS